MVLVPFNLPIINNGLAQPVAIIVWTQVSRDGWMVQISSCEIIWSPEVT